MKKLTDIDPLLMTEHERLARLWCHANGGKGVRDQIRAIMEQLTAEQLKTMLTTIGVKTT